MFIEEFLEYVSTEDRESYYKLYLYMKELGYKMKRAKTKDINFLFVHSKVKKNILKFSIQSNKPVVKVKFYINEKYSEMFSNSIKATIEEYNYKYTGCYGCGRCNDQLMGYYYTYPDESTFFRCGMELIELMEFNKTVEEELQILLLNQHNYYLNNLLT